jgi:hypothetical protein
MRKITKEYIRDSHVPGQKSPLPPTPLSSTGLNMGMNMVHLTAKEPGKCGIVMCQEKEDKIY